MEGDLRRETSPLNATVSVIIVNYNGGSKLLECVDSVFRFTSDFELILADNASTDNSLQLIEKRFPQVMIVRNSENLGFAGGNNVAIKRSKGRWIVLLNPDTKVTNKWLDNLLNRADLSSQIGIVAPKLLHMDGKTINSTGHVFDFRRGFARDRGSGETDEGQYEVAQEVASCCFACAAIKREVVNQIGLLDEKMIMYYEDVDFCIRARVAGWKVLYSPKSIVLHHGAGVTPTRRLRALLRRSTPYRLRIMLKSYNRVNALKYGTMSLLKSMGAGAKNRDFQYFLSYARSPIWNLLHLPLAERRLVQLNRRTPDNMLANFSPKPPGGASSLME